ncbi:MAG TPA: hypothetical protein VJ948_10130 [Acidimicrobiia bacterium]|nr:hypothetical protein [Acidimicrobiia bacterium]
MERFGEPDPSEEVPEEGRATFEEVEAASHSVIGQVADSEQARVIVEDLENSGVPTTSIELVGAEGKEASGPDEGSDIPDSDAFTNLSKSTIVGAGVGIIAGALLGLVLSLLIPPMGPVWGLVLGGIFGAAVGGAAGGMSVAKYGSRAWNETYQIEEEQRLAVAVHHASAEVVRKAEEVMGRHLSTGSVRRL